MAVTNPYYEFTPEFIPGTKARSDEVNLQYQAIQNAFDFLPGTSDALTTGTATFAPESGAGNAYVVTMPDTRTTEQDGDEVVFFATHTNTGAATLEVDGLGAKSIVTGNGLALVANDLQDGLLYVMRYDASNTRYQLVGPSTSYLTNAAASAAAAAASAAAALTSENNAAASAILAQAWAVNPEDDDVDGFPGQFSAFHWAQKALASAAFNRVNTDLATATPPTTEAVTGAYDIYDADDTDRLAWFGYGGSNILEINNLMRNGEVRINQFDSLGAEKLLFRAAISGTGLYYNGISRLWSNSGGAVSLRSDGNTDTEARILRFEHNGPATIRAIIGHVTGSAFEIQNQIHGANVVIKAEDAGGVLQTLGTFDPDALSLEVGPFTMGTSFMGATNSGRARILPEATTSTNPGIIPRGDDLDTGIGWQAANNLSLIAGGFEMMRLDGTSSFQRVMAQYPLFIAESTPENDLVGYGQFSVNGGTAQFTDASGNDFNFLSTLRIPTTAELRMQAAGSGIVYLYSTGSTDAEARYISLRHADGVSRGYMGHFSSLLELRNEIHGGAFRVNCENSSGVLTQMIDAQPDGIFDIRGATSVVITLGASAEFGANFALNGAASLYYDNQGRFYTMTSGSAQIRRATTTDTDQCRLGFANSNGVDRGWVGFGVQGNSRIELNSEVHGGAVYLTGETAGGAAQNLFSGTPGANDTIVYSNGVSELVVGTTKITANTLFLNERSAAIADVAGDGQLWVLNDSPNILMFTDDSGQDYAVAMNGGYVNDNVNVNNSWNFNTTGNRSANFVSYHGDGGNDTITLGNSTGTGLTNFPIYDSITIIAPGSGNITISEGTGTTLYDETGTDTVGGVVLSGGAVTIFRASATDYIIWGNGYT